MEHDAQKYWVQRHYAQPGLAARLLDALARAGKDLERLTPEDLASIDAFHVRGREATQELAQAVGLGPGERVLDVGSGLGGTARYLAAAFRCQVAALDLSADYCRAAAQLTQRSGLADRVVHIRGDATALPFADGAFDTVWSEHAAMNIPDKARLYRELARVLKPGGVLAVHDILAGPVTPLHFPVPWADSPDGSFLITPQAMRQHLEAAGFEICRWTDTTEVTRAWFTAMAERNRREGPPTLGLGLLLGPAFQTMGRNQRHNLEEGRILVAQVIGRKLR